MHGSATERANTEAPRRGLLRNRLGGLVVAQGFGTFNDNAWKYIVLTLAMRPILERLDGDAQGRGADARQRRLERRSGR